jgi:hypothetical protein
MAHLSCSTIGELQFIDASLALAAALFWLIASLTKIPNSIDHFIDALRKQSRLNAVAAFFAALTACLQAYLVIQPTCINLG